jgi:hypothetical protein
VSPVLGFGARYDFFDPSTKVGHNSQRAYSVFVNSVIIVHNLRLYAEYQHQEDEIPGTSGSKTKNGTLTLLVMLAL